MSSNTVPTPLGGSLLSLWRFARRQYQLVRLYRPGVWLLACGVCTVDLLARAFAREFGVAFDSLPRSVRWRSGVRRIRWPNFVQ